MCRGSTVSLKRRGAVYLYILRRVDLLHRGARHRRDTFAAGLSQGQKPILLWPEDAERHISEAFQRPTQIYYLPNLDFAVWFLLSMYAKFVV